MAASPSRKETLLPPIHANFGVELNYRHELQQLVREMFADALRRVTAVYRADPPRIGMAQDADPVVALRRALSAWGRDWEKRLSEVSEKLAKLFASRSSRATDAAMLHALREAGFAVDFQVTTRMRSALRAVIAENVGLIKSIGQKFHTDVQQQVWGSVLKGYDQATLTENLRKSYGVSWRRAALIARDQSHKARAVMEAARRQEIGIEEAVWVHSGGGRVPRPEHVRWGRERKRYDVSKGMYSQVDHEHVWPGTPINCRCVSRAVLPFMKEG